jgi:hypothetical protein
MTAEDSNNRIKHGCQVPRSWIPEFNITHGQPPDDKPINQQELLGELSKAVRLAKRRRGNAFLVRNKNSALNRLGWLVMGLFAIVLLITHPLATAALFGVYLLIYSLTK